ncbi:MAG: hypothetical protein ACLUKN_11330 [Bacilli bacterium]
MPISTNGVVEWPNWRDGYDVDIAEGKICKTMHNVINAWYIGAIKCYNKTARKLGEPEYPEAELVGVSGRVLRFPKETF